MNNITIKRIHPNKGSDYRRKKQVSKIYRMMDVRTLQEFLQTPHISAFAVLL